MLLASGRVPTSLVTGTLGSLGEYDDCLAVNSSVSQLMSEPFVGQYCMAKITLPLELDFVAANDTFYQNFIIFSKQFNTPSFYNAICVPSTCTQTEVEDILQEVVSPINLKVKIQDCETLQEQMPLTTMQKISM